MSTKFSEFIAKNKIDARRIVSASRKLERLQPEDRAKKLARRRAKAGGAPAAEGDDAKKVEKPRTGRPVTPRLVETAQNGKALSGPAKTRLLRALNRILEQKKQQPVELKTLF
jgi:hypothetical protein